MKNAKYYDFFLSSNTPQGFVSKFSEFTPENNDFKCYILHGTPGVGKSSIVSAVSEMLKAEGNISERIFCCNDISTLDGVICHDRGIAVADGTYPHIINPTYPQATHKVISLYDCCDSDKIYSHRYEIAEAKDMVTRSNKYCQRFLSASGQLMNDSFQLSLEVTDVQKVGALAKRVANREFKVHRKRSIAGKEYIRFLSGITKQGIVMHKNTPYELAENIYLLEDEYGASSKLLLSALRSYALEAGYDVYSCYCPFFPHTKMEHMFIPQLSLGFMTTNKYHPIDVNPYKVINSRRFSDVSELKSRKKRIAFNKKSAFQLLDQAFIQLDEISGYNMKLQNIYGRYTNYDMVECIKDKLLKEIVR